MPSSQVDQKERPASLRWIWYGVPTSNAVPGPNDPQGVYLPSDWLQPRSLISAAPVIQSHHLHNLPQVWSPTSSVSSCSSGSSSLSCSPAQQFRPQSGMVTRSRFNKSGFTRSRTGCTTCRSQKKKCDELKPQCTRCRNNGHVCEYPNDRLAFMDRQAEQPLPSPHQYVYHPRQHPYDDEHRRDRINWTTMTLPPLNIRTHRVKPASDVTPCPCPSPEMVTVSVKPNVAGIVLPPISTFDEIPSISTAAAQHA